MFTINFAKQNLFKHGVLFDDVPRPWVLKPFVAVKAVFRQEGKIMEKKKLLKRLSALGFAMYECRLYCDTHPYVEINSALE